MKILHKLVRGVDVGFSTIISIILVLLMLYSCYALWDNMQIYKQAAVADEIMHYKPQKPQKSETESVTEPSDTSNPSITELKQINPDVTAWLTIERTNIDYPVMQAADNMKYLNLDIYGKYSLAGSIFLDSGCDSAYNDKYSLLYGHHMEGGAMFGDILNYEDESYFNEHQTGWLYVPDKTYELEIFAYLHVDAYTSPMFIVGLSNTGYDERLTYIKENAIFYSNIEITAEDRIVALSTCSSATTNGRSIIVAKLLEN